MASTARTTSSADVWLTLYEDRRRFRAEDARRRARRRLANPEPRRGRARRARIRRRGERARHAPAGAALKRLEIRGSRARLPRRYVSRSRPRLHSRRGRRRRRAAHGGETLIEFEPALRLPDRRAAEGEWRDEKGLALSRRLLGAQLVDRTARPRARQLVDVVLATCSSRPSRRSPRSPEGFAQCLSARAEGKRALTTAAKRTRARARGISRDIAVMCERCSPRSTGCRARVAARAAACTTTRARSPSTRASGPSTSRRSARRARSFALEGGVGHVRDLPDGGAAGC